MAQQAAVARIGVGDKAPDFKLEDQDGNTHSLKQYKGRRVVLFFYPKDLTSGCTREACDFRDLSKDFADAGAVVLGISILNAKSKKKFADKESLNFPLLADDATNEEGKPAPVVADAYGVWVEKSMYGKKYMGIERSTFVVGSTGKVEAAWDKVKVPGHADEVLQAIRGM